MNENSVGKPVDRVDGPLKVTGQARYAAEFNQPNMAHAVLVQSSISKGNVTAIETGEAQKIPGVLAIITSKNAQRIKDPKQEKGGGGMAGNTVAPLKDDAVHFDGEDVAVVIADTLERAQWAASKVKVSYHADDPDFDISTSKKTPKKPEEHFGKKLQVKRGDAGGAFENAAVKVDETYSTPAQTHNPMELSATIAVWDGPKLTIYNATQAIIGDRKIVSDMLDVAEENIRVVCPFVGGGFGCKGSTWPHTLLAAVAAQKVGRPVSLVLSRPQMFSSVGHRGKTVQRVALGTDAAGTFSAVRHETKTETSTVGTFIETCGLSSGMLYATPNFEATHELYNLDIPSAAQMRAPGEAPGSFALESAIDELAWKLKVDPLELRLRNYAETDLQKNKPYSSKHLKECYSQAAEKFGWSKRTAEPRSMRDGRILIGYGMATALYPANRSAATVRARMGPDGTLVVVSATQDLGTGTYTIMSQIAADAMGIPVEKVRFELGDSQFPRAPVSGGSQTAASVGPAVRAAVEELRKKLTELSIAAAGSPLNGKPADQISYGDSRIFLKDDEKTGETYAEIVKRNGAAPIEAEASSAPSNKEPLSQEIDPKKANGSGPPKDEFSFWSFGAQFAEVRVDPDLGVIRVSRVVSAFDVGRVLNRKTARSQAIGGIVFGIGAALLEETIRDPRNGRAVNANLADYRVPVNADIPEVEILFVEEPDTNFNPLGARGIGEIGITGITAAIANAVYHATGKRVRELPITPEKIL